MLIALSALSTACASATSRPDTRAGLHSEQPTPLTDTLVTAEWLSQHLDDPDLVVLDCGGGIAASSNAVVMTRHGFADVAVYMVTRGVGRRPRQPDGGRHPVRPSHPPASSRPR